MQYIAVTLATICIVVVSGDRRCTKSRGCGPSMCGPLEVPVRGRPRRDHFCRPLFTPPWELRKRRHCVCKRRYVRNSWGECIPWTKCLTCKFRWQRDYRECAPGCPATCNMPLVTSCNEPCTSGCVCPPGWVVHPKRPRMCIKAYKCLPKCPANSSFQACVPSCLPKCGQNRPKECAVTCNTGACVCHDGYIELERGGKNTCVLQSKCSWYTRTANSFRHNATHHNGGREWSHSSISLPGDIVRHQANTDLRTPTAQQNGERRKPEDTPLNVLRGHNIATPTAGTESELPDLSGETGRMGFGTSVAHSPGAGRNIVDGSSTNTGSAFSSGSAGTAWATVGVPTRGRLSNVSAGRGGKPVVLDAAGARSPETEHSTSADNSRNALSSATPGALGVTSGVVAGAASAVAVAAGANANMPGPEKPLTARQPSGTVITEGSESGGTVGLGGAVVSGAVRAPSGDTLRQGGPNLSVEPGVFPSLSALSSAIESEPDATLSLGKEENVSADSTRNTAATRSHATDESSRVAVSTPTVSAHSNVAAGTGSNVNVPGIVDKRSRKASKYHLPGDGTNTEDSLGHTTSSLSESTVGETSLGTRTPRALGTGERSAVVSGTRNTLPLTPTVPLSAGTGMSAEGSLPIVTRIFREPLGGKTSLDSSTSAARGTGGGRVAPDTAALHHTGPVSSGAINVANAVSNVTASDPMSSGTKPAIDTSTRAGVGSSREGAIPSTGAKDSAGSSVSGSITSASEGRGVGGAISDTEGTLLSGPAGTLSASSGARAGSSPTQPLPGGTETTAASSSRN